MRRNVGIEPENYVPAPKPPDTASGIGSRYRLYDIPEKSVHDITAVITARIAANIRQQNPAPRADMPQDEWLKAWAALVLANAMEGWVAS